MHRISGFIFDEIIIKVLRKVMREVRSRGEFFQEALLRGSK